MPWTAKDAESHTKQANTAEKRRVWAEVANERLAACLKQHEGEVDEAQRKQCEGSAIRQANAAVGRIKEGGMFGDVGQIAKSAIETGLAILNGTGELAPDRAKTLLHALESDLDGVWQEGIGLLPTAPGHVKVDGRLVSIRELADAYTEAEEQDTAVKAQQARSKKYGIAVIDPPKGNRTKPGEYSDVPDSAFGDPVNYKWPADAEHARAALGYFNHSGAQSKGGYSSGDWAKVGGRLATLISKHLTADYQYKDGKLVQKGEAKEVAADGSLDDRLSRIKAAFRATFRREREGSETVLDSDLWARDVLENNEHFGDSVICQAENGMLYAVTYNQAADGSYAFAPRDQWAGAILTYVPAVQQEPAQECSFAESMPLMYVGDLTEAGEPLVAALSETITPGTGPRSPVIVDFELIRPGPGNKRDNHYYPAEVLKRDASKFTGVDIFVTDHKEKERSERTKVGRVREIAGFTNDGAPVGRAVIYDPDQAEKTRNRANVGELSTLECSIFASGLARPGKVSGKDYKVVEAITSATALELVSKAGAGGHAKNLVESGGNEMGEEQEVPKEDEEQEAPPEETPEGEPETQPEEQVPTEEVEKALAEAKLPEGLQKWVARGTYKTKEELGAAIAEAQADAKKLTGSGSVFAMGASQPVAPDTKELDEGLAEVDKQHNVVPLFAAPR
jgi:hypothetical protein